MAGSGHERTRSGNIFANFLFDPEAQALIQKVQVAELQVHFANIAPDVLVGDLLKTTRASQIFTVFGQPDVAVKPQKDGTFVVELRGVDIYDSLPGEVHSTRGGEEVGCLVPRHRL